MPDNRRNHHRIAVRASLFTIRVQLVNLMTELETLRNTKAISQDQWETIALPLVEAHSQLRLALKEDNNALSGPHQNHR